VKNFVREYKYIIHCYISNAINHTIYFPQERNVTRPVFVHRVAMAVESVALALY